MPRLSVRIFFLLVLLMGVLVACTTPPVNTPAQQASPQASYTPSLPTQVASATPPLAPTLPPGTELPTTAPPTSTPIPALRLAVIGDYGRAGRPEADVASLALSWQPDYILTTGDNNYPDGEQETIDENIGQYFHSYISPYYGSYGEGAASNRFFPTLGNHDWNTDDARPYLDYFTLPGNERYYDVLLGPVHVFAVDSDSREPEGVSRKSAQATWLQGALVASTAPWKLVIMHHAPYSSGQHGAVDWMRWPFAEWGATAVLAGHDHTYERLLVEGIPYFVNGLGGGSIYSFIFIDQASQVRYNDDYGAMLITVDEKQITFEFSNRHGELIDTYTVSK